jgi:hypothetical protein
MPQGSVEWFNARRGIPTASRFDKIISPVQGKASTTQEKFINELIAESLLPTHEENKFVSADMEAGMKLEAEARCAYELGFATEKVIEAGFCVASCGLFGGSPDALVGENGGVEIKCPMANTHIGYVRGGVLPNDYKCQVHGHLVVSGRKWWDFFSYHRGLDPFHVRVVPDAFTALLAAELAKFCARYNAERAKFKLRPIGLTE